MGGAQSNCKPPTHRVHVTTGDIKSHGTGFLPIDVSINCPGWPTAALEVTIGVAELGSWGAWEFKSCL